MAKVNYGQIVNDARGKQGGTVFSKNKSGAYTRRKVTPANPNTPSQSGVRSSFALLSKLWGTGLSDIQRASWINYANTYPRIDVFGASIRLTGLNMFISFNAILNALGLASAIVAPATNVVVPIAFDPASLVVNAGAGTVVFEETAVNATGTNEFYLFATAEFPPGRAAYRNQFRLIGKKASVAGPYPADVDISALYLAKFPSLLAGQKVAVLIATVDTLTGLTTVGTVCVTTVV